LHKSSLVKIVSNAGQMQRTSRAGVAVVLAIIQSIQYVASKKNPAPAGIGTGTGADETGRASLM